jgi:hypothetical protein
MNAGSAADWFAAVGTVGTLVFAVMLFWRGRELERRRDADAFVSWRDSTQVGDHWLDAVMVRNVGNRPILNAVVITAEKDARRRYVGELLEPPHNHTVFESNDSALSAPQAPRGELIILAFIDSNGQRWYRSLLTNRYYSRVRGSWIGRRTRLE